MKIQHGAEVAEAYPRRYSKFNNEINAKDTVPSKDEVKKVLNAKNVFEANKNDEAWCNSHFNSCPWGFGYKASPRSNSGSATEAMKLFLLAKLIKWQDLETQLTRTVKETYKIKAEVAKPVLEYWKTNINQILSVINAAAAEVKTKTEGLQEDIEKHDTLNPKLWNEDNTLKEEVKAKIDQIIEEFLDGLKEDEISIDVKDVIITGSNCSYNYTKDSDIDLHIVAGHIDAPENLYDKIYSAYRSLFNKKLDIEFYGIPVEIYVETEETPRVSNGVYSVMNNAWIKEPVAEDIPDIDKDAFDKEFKVWEDRYNKIVDSSEEKLDEAKRSIIKSYYVDEYYHYVLKYNDGNWDNYYTGDLKASTAFSINPKDAQQYDDEKAAKKDIYKVNRLWCEECEMDYNEFIHDFGGFEVEEVMDGEKTVMRADEPLHEDLNSAKSIIADQIRGEWEAIQNYNKAIDDLSKVDMTDFGDVMRLLDDIADEEKQHVGELQQALSTIDSTVDTKVDEGKDEAEEKLANPIKTESLNESSIVRDTIDLGKNSISYGCDSDNNWYVAKYTKIDNEGRATVDFKKKFSTEAEAKKAFNKLAGIKEDLTEEVGSDWL